MPITLAKRLGFSPEGHSFRPCGRANSSKSELPVTRSEPMSGYILGTYPTTNLDLDFPRVRGSEYTLERTGRAGGPRGIRTFLFYPVIASGFASIVWLVQAGTAKLLRNARDEVNR